MCGRRWFPRGGSVRLGKEGNRRLVPSGRRRPPAANLHHCQKWLGSLALRIPTCHTIRACVEPTSLGSTHKLLSLAPASRSTGPCSTPVSVRAARGPSPTVDQFPISGPTCDSRQRMGR
ncbi:hypothetical protein PSPO01_02101 [Paraphaeosphaeria sporulosa]